MLLAGVTRWTKSGLAADASATGRSHQPCDREGSGDVVRPLTNLLASLPDATAGEITEALVTAHGVRLERIVSHGQASPAGFWYDQDEAEWVLVLSGSARLAIDGESEDRLLREGDAIFLPAHCRHRVTWTDPAQPTVWLVLFIDPALAPKAADSARMSDRDYGADHP
jgi:cupin 2 domain-containing protein